MPQAITPIAITLQAEDRTRAAVDSAVRGFMELERWVEQSTAGVTMASARLESLRSTATQLSAALGGALGAASFVGLIRSTIDAGEELNKLSQKVGISVERLSELKLAAQLADVDLATFAKGQREFNRSLVEAADSSSKVSKLFAALGVDIKAGPDAAFRQFADSFAKLPEGELKAAAAMEVLKKAGSDMIPLLNGGAAGLDDAADKAKRLGLVITGDFAKAAEQFNDNLKLLGKGSEALAVSLTKDLVPALATLTTNLADSALRGEKWLGFWRESNKLIAAGLSQLPEWTALGRAARDQADRLFGVTPGQVSVGKIRGLDAPALSTATPDANKVRDILAGVKAPQAVADATASVDSYLSSLREQLAGLETGELEKMRQKLVETFGKVDMSKLGRAELDRFIAKLSEAGESIERIDQISVDAKWATAMRDSARIASEAISKAREAADTFARQNGDSIEGLEFELSLIGKTATERAKLMALRKVDRDAAAARLQVPGDAANRDVELADIDRRAAETRAAVEENFRATYEAGRDVYKALDVAAREYYENVTNGARKSTEIFTNSVRSIEDALTQFFATGKVDAKGFVDALKLQFARLAAQEITGPIVKSIGGDGGLLAGLFGRSGGGGASGSSFTGDYALDQLIGLVPKFASGIDYVPHDMLAMIHAGERIVPAAENARGANGVEVNIINNAGAAISIRPAGPRLDGKRMVRDIFIDLVQTDGVFRRAVAGAGVAPTG